MRLVNFSTKKRSSARPHQSRHFDFVRLGVRPINVQTQPVDSDAIRRTQARFNYFVRLRSVHERSHYGARFAIAPIDPHRIPVEIQTTKNYVKNMLDNFFKIYMNLVIFNNSNLSLFAVFLEFYNLFIVVYK